MIQPAPLRLEMPDPQLIEVYRKMTPQQRLAAAFSATEMVRSRLEAHVAGSNPAWSMEQVKREVARRLLVGGG